MEDRELLELAAKAAGVERGKWDLKYLRQLGHCVTQSMMWNPITDDGDALRLACDLGLRVFPVSRTHSGAACSAVGAVTGERLSEVADASLDTYEATRQAIVRAAAEIGRALP